MTEEQFKVIVRAFFPNAVFTRDEDCDTVINWFQNDRLVGVFSPTQQFWDVFGNCSTQEQMVTYFNYLKGVL